VTVDLEAGTATGSGYDALASIENVTIIGTIEADDTLLGDDGPNALDGGEGNDTIGGRGGADTLIGGRGADTLDGGTGADTGFGGGGTDTCISIEEPHDCEL
jgi:Ca2+-binding RTX toxin-like protein